MRPNGGIDAAAGGVLGQHQVMQTLAHAVQSLEFVSRGRHGGLGCHMQHGGNGMGVVGGKLRIDAVA